MIHLVPINADGNAPGALPAAAAEVLSSTAGLYQRTGFEPPWTRYLAFEGEQCVGWCGFLAPPRENRVEIVYSTFPGSEARAVATRMGRALIAIAVEALPGVALVAWTPPEPSASTRVLEKLGFVRVGERDDPPLGLQWEWTLHPDRRPKVSLLPARAR